ncbi:MAG TPA: NAD(P)-binding domain-containing protein [Gammaproteobacteria bacterium]
MDKLYGLLIYGSFFILMYALFVHSRRKKQRKSLEIKEENEKAGLMEPASLHPLIDPNICKGCGACVNACPERDKQVLGLIAGKAELINPSHCIGHGACRAACPFDAITLVFGSEKRGVDIPHVSPEFETNVPGLFIAGELGGMGLIRNAITQGVEAMDYIAKRDGIGKSPGINDVVIIGAGPAGFAATLAAMKKKLKHVTVEQDSLGGTVFNFPRGKLVMTAPVELPLAGKMKFTETSKERVLEFWQKIESEQKVQINYQENVKNVVNHGNHFEVITDKGNYKTKTVLLCIGRRGTPRKLGVPGEELPKVVYRLIDPEQYRGMHVLIVGGGDSALEAATSIADEEGTTVTLSYRSESFGRAKEKNRQKIDQAVAKGRLRVIFKSNVTEITEKTVKIDKEGELIEIPNDGIIVSAGGILPTPFLKSIGIEVETKYGTA